MRIRDLADGAMSPAEAFVNSIYTQSEHGSSLPFVLSYFPVASMNPFQRLLYCRASEAGFAIVPTLHREHLGSVNWRNKSVLHLHWLASVLKGATTGSAARARVNDFRAEMDKWRAAGHRIVWSMHNVLPHDCAFPDAEIELRRALVNGSDAIHVLSRASVQQAREHYSVPEDKVFHIPHPSYEGWYANVGDRTAARLDLDLTSSEFVFLFFGSLQPYKGLVELIEAFTRLRESKPAQRLRLIIAGKAVDSDYVDSIRLAMQDSRGIDFFPSSMEERELQTLFNAADVAVLPYLRTLNSGVAMLAATFGKSVVAPRIGALLETFSQDTGLLYSGEPGDGLVDAMERALTCKPDAEAMDQVLLTHSPERTSREFFSGVLGKVFKLPVAAGTREHEQ